MKKGFFLLEALLACVLISLLIGAIVQYHAQWTRSHKLALDRAKALATLMDFVEQGRAQPTEYAITKKRITVAAPESIDMQIVEPAQCTQIIVSWHDSICGLRTISAIIGGDDA